MDKYDLLIIRACKSNIAASRLIRRVKRIVRRRNATPYECINLGGMVRYVIAPIVEKYNPIPLGELIEQLNPKQAWKFGMDEGHEYCVRAAHVLFSRLRLTKSSQLPGYVAPLGFRKRFNKAIGVETAEKL